MGKFARFFWGFWLDEKHIDGHYNQIIKMLIKKLILQKSRCLTPASTRLAYVTKLAYRYAQQVLRHERLAG